jgi:hypothetical protein
VVLVVLSLGQIFCVLDGRLPAAYSTYHVRGGVGGGGMYGGNECELCSALQPHDHHVIFANCGDHADHSNCH